MILKKGVIICSFVIILAAAVIFDIIRFKGQQDKPQQNTSDAVTEQEKSLPTVIIDAGHGGEDGGTSGADGTLEKDLNLKIAISLSEMLCARGFEVILTRDTDILLYDRDSDYLGHKKSQDMAKRLEIANSHENAIFVSIHMNSFSQSKYRGLQVYYSENNARSELLAQTIQDCVRTNLQPENTRKTKPSAGNIYLLDKLTMPAVLVECGFLSNPEECALLNDENYRHRLCIVLCTAIEGFTMEK